ncbi:MAG: GET complex subunit get1 [Chaenotheca gracillima]|nr:MAG: GET complex subunit get1 [Chaenotheca gracillima]
MSLSRATLLSLKLPQLKHLAVQCGVNSSGTKTEIASYLLEELKVGKTSVVQHDPRKTRTGATSQTERILSIDMGIRNLAYCVLETSTKSAHESPIILAWKRIAVVPRAPSPASPRDSLEGDTKAGKKPPKESFEPSIFASHAYDLLTKILLPHTPTRILIERQRYRSMGSASIQEWTVRVNMFEGMLYAVLRTLQGMSEWKGTVEAVSPARVVAFWVGEDGVRSQSSATKVSESEDGGKVRKRRAKTAKAKSKGDKIDLVGRWLRDREILRFDTSGGQSSKMRDAYLLKWQGKGKSRGQKVTVDRIGLSPSDILKEEGENGALVEDEKEEIGKLDDLADCLLQAMAHVRWQDNRRKLEEIKEGEEIEVLANTLSSDRDL